jgi:hypothetical protein
MENLNSTVWEIPILREDKLATVIPISTYASGPVSDPEHTLFMWRIASLSKARGMTVGFFVGDERLECLWRSPKHYLALFLRHGVGVLIEPDFSLWADAPLVEQLWNTHRIRTLGRLWQEAGLAVIPNLMWSDERSFQFCFTGIPVGAPVTACECRTPGGNDADRRAFLRGLTEAVRQVRPQHVLVYGGREHSYWLTGNLPKGPEYTLLPSWTSARRKIRAAQERREHERYQLNLFTGGDQWADEEVVAA